MEVRFYGEDGRSQTFALTGLPLPGLHADLASAFATRTGSTGTTRTLASARNLWGVLQRFVRFLAGLPHPPATLGQLTASHLRQFRLHRSTTTTAKVADRELGYALKLLEAAPRQRLRPEVVELLGRRQPVGSWPAGAPGYSDREFRQIMAAARRDVAAIRERLRAGERLLARAWTQPQTIVGSQQRVDAARLLEAAITGNPGAIPFPTGRLWDFPAMKQLAARLFLITDDLTPLLVLGVGLTGRNVETIKELLAAHQVLDGQAVAIEVTKRRRGPGRNHDTVHWEIGRPSRQLHTPGGYYLLLHELTRRSRSWSATDSVWSIWTLHTGHHDPFARSLDYHSGERVIDWVRRHDLRDDHEQPLKLTLNRLRTTVEVRTAKAVGGHLPSATRTNTMDVLFRHYLRGDPTVQDWAADEVTAALVDAEHNARRAHLRVLAGAGAGEHGHDLAAAAAAALQVSPQLARQALDGELDTAFAACLDIHGSPFDRDADGVCRVSFLTCLRCPNALATKRHLPALLALLDELQAARQAMDLETWWRRHGQTWLVITADILPKFTPAEVAQARDAKPTGTLLGLLEHPVEQP